MSSANGINQNSQTTAVEMPQLMFTMK